MVCYLKAVKGSIIFKCQDMVRDGEDVAMGSDQTPKVDGFSCWHKRRPNRWEGWFQIAFLFNWALLCLHVMTDFPAGLPGSSMERFFISHWTMSAPGIQRRTLVRSGVHSSTCTIVLTKAAIRKHKWALRKVFVIRLCSKAMGQSGVWTQQC